MPHKNLIILMADEMRADATGFMGNPDCRTPHLDRFAAQAIDYLTETRSREKPFYLHLNLTYPHPPYAVEEPYFSMYDRQAIRPWPYQLPENAPLPFRAMREHRSGWETPEAAFREIQAVYYGMVTKVDSLLGRVLQTIEAQGLLENSVVIFTADHGDFAGQYGLVEKWDTCMNDCILHMPLILWAPDLPHGARVRELSEHVDLVPTLLDLLGLQKPRDWGLHGQSLLPVIAGQPGKPAVFADGGHEEEMWARFNFEPNQFAQLDGKQETYRHIPEAMARTKMVRTPDWKLVMRLAGGNELYDLRNDPYELNNLWGRHLEDAALLRVVLDLQQQLIEWCLRTDTDRPYQEKVGA